MHITADVQSKYYFIVAEGIGTKSKYNEYGQDT